MKPNHIYQRLVFSRWFIKNGLNYRLIIFSDENCFEIGTKNHSVWRGSEEVYKSIEKIYLLHTPKVMIWGVIGYNYRSNLVIFNQSVNSDIYVQQAIIGLQLKITAYWNLISQQDKAWHNTFKKFLATLTRLRISYLPSWQPHSPCLSSI